jgi:hypothetical protein
VKSGAISGLCKKKGTENQVCCGIPEQFLGGYFSLKVVSECDVV